DNVVIDEQQTLVFDLESTTEFDPLLSYLENTEIGKSCRLNRGDDKVIMVTKVGKTSSMGNKDGKRSTEVDDDGFIYQDNIIEKEEDQQYKELDLDDFDSASDCDGDYKADRNRSLGKLAKPKLTLKGHNRRSCKASQPVEVANRAGKYNGKEKVVKAWPLVGEFHIGGVRHDVYIRPMINKGIYMLKASYAARYFEVSFDVLLLCYLLLENRIISRSPRCFIILRHLSVVGCLVRLAILFFFISCKGDRVYVLGDEEFGFFPYQHFYRGSAGRKFLEKPEHFSHPIVDFLVLLEDGVLKSFHSFGVRCHVVPYSSFESGF
ncbi:hypothetical protein Tco_0702008, partial [Tanacetum coccineum]